MGENKSIYSFIHVG